MLRGARTEPDIPRTDDVRVRRSQREPYVVLLIARRSRIAVVAAALGGCVSYTTRPPGAAVLREPTTVNASFGRTWDAVIDVFAEENISIRTIERASGFIAAERTSIAYDTREDEAYGERLADCGTFGPIRLMPRSASYNIVVRGDSTRSTVRVTVKYLNYGADRTRMVAQNERECSTRGVFEATTEESVKRRAETRR